MRAHRLLRPFGDVRPGEALGVVLLFLDVFLILSGYYVLKTVREGLILGSAGAEMKTYTSAIAALLLIGVVPAYGALASRVARVRLINVCYAAVVGCLAVFFVLGRAGVDVGVAFYLWLAIVNVFLVAQFWSYANDLYSEEQGKRLFAVIALGGALGAICGPRLATLTTTYPLLLIAAAMLGVCVLLYNVVDRMARRAPRQAAIAEAPVGTTGGFKLVLTDRYLFLIAAMLIVANLVNTLGEFLLSSAATAHAEEVAGASEDARREVIKAFYADFFFWVNLVGLVVQAFLVSRVLKHAGVKVALFVLPLIALAGYGAIGALGGIAVIRAAKIAENGTDYSLQNTVRQALFLPTSREAKYKAKAAIDTFFVRFGDTLAALTVALALHVAHLSMRGLALTNVVLAVVWLGIAAAIAGVRAPERTPAPAAG